MTYTLTEEQRIIILDSLTDRETKLLRLADLYKRNGNTGGQRDCINEWRKVHAFYEQFYNESK